MPDPVVVSEVRNRSLWIRLNRPEAMNSLSPSVLKAVDKALDEALEQADVMTVVLTGTGRAFCAGADLKYINDQLGDRGTSGFLESVQRTTNRLDRFPKPIIAALNGLTLAGGLELVLCCDLVIAARSARIGDAHANYGLLPGGGASVRLPRTIGLTRAKYLLYTGEFVTAEEMREAGLVNRVVDDAQLEATTQEVADLIATKSPLGLRRMKALIDDGLDQPEDTALRLESLASEVHTLSSDFREGLQAFEAKRPPRFTGK
ncbi:enoyl-CoA hydratase [Acidovorax sp. HMWF018]|jgi:enoyl-CoA hydratase|uniref:enoyl-CoA hydratase/isomerase family protein n=1 Tax=unclassified Acidovorax TaxID=2684926 RepID=UPI000D3BE25E|nr:MULTISPECIES: enoyl-CoA hydratase/isomerase family protein [unclassified Acidovorax]NCU66839.1 enoyl-CoA hydratase/isomerase family protein [Acidovorax sp. 210-6]PTT43219.1 enoyl-CoA hydratase [Acidovorax sp. HMWF018]